MPKKHISDCKLMLLSYISVVAFYDLYFCTIFSYYSSVSLVKISSAMTTINLTKCSDNFGIQMHKEYLDESFQDYQ